jgi:hypothetical protein
MAQFNSSHSKTASFGEGMLQVMRTMITSVMAITAVLVLAGIVFGLTGCTKEKSKEASVSSVQNNQGPAASMLPHVSSVEPAPAKRKKAIKRASTLTYTSRTYGVSFRFPGQYELTTPGDGAKSALAEEVPSNFVQVGGVPVATIELPSGSATSFFSVSANKLLTSQECGQFAIPAPADLPGDSPVDENDGSIPLKTSIHGVEFTKVENATEQEDVKYYHHFEPATDGVGGTCYEFAMGVEQSRVSSQNLDYPELFDKLERVMATVKIKSEETPTAAATVPAHDGKSY